MSRALVVALVCLLSTAAVSQALCDGVAGGANVDPPVLAKHSEPGRPYTSLVVDARGFGLKRSMSPKIRRADQSEVWGTLKNLTDKDYDVIQDRGLVGYVATVEDALKNSRCGGNPMIVKAVGVGSDKSRADPVVADEDAKLLIDENGLGRFLEGFNVIFINGEKPAPAAPASGAAQAE